MAIYARNILIYIDTQREREREENNKALLIPSVRRKFGNFWDRPCVY